MAALGWLLNLDFAGGGGVVDTPAAGVVYSHREALQRKRYGYGYRYIEKGAVWITSLTPFL